MDNGSLFAQAKIDIFTEAHASSQDKKPGLKWWGKYETYSNKLSNVCLVAIFIDQLIYGRT